ncbi:YbaK/prolyl-tRNA synthetase associated domain-containing protein [Streptacidiphilus sp. PB12-B1b]|nr:YbaK/EbsC family protein [Streptacidiphilus sp. PB12-B1b]QMU80471.1 YbaK/prolyl-tRNA synthetase associated domain-containing protein [Streptacidiphilus sp. PB12-B1b]
MAALSAGRARYRLLEHPPEGRTDTASRLRGHPLHQAAKSLVIRVALGGRTSRYVLAVVQGDRRVDLDAVRDCVGGTRAGMADRATAERLTGCVSGSIIPFSFDPALTLIADRDLLEQEEIYFNAARLDLSVALPVPAYREIAAPLSARVALPAAEAAPAATAA